MMDGIRALAVVPLLIAVILAAVFLFPWEHDDVTSVEARNEKKEDLSAEEKKYIEYHAMVAEQIHGDHMEKVLKFLTRAPHMAGTPESKKQAEWVAEKFKEYGLDKVEIKRYKALLSFPEEPGSITILDEYGDEGKKYISIEKSANKYENDSRVVPPFIAYSAAGVFDGGLVYANFGRESDFDYLAKMGVNLSDAVVLVRYGMESRQKKLKVAEKLKVKGVILYSDPEQYAPFGKPYPDSWYLPADGVQRGTMLLFRGDPLSRGYPSIDGFYRYNQSRITYFPTMPVLPIGYGIAEQLLRTLDGKPPPENSWKGTLKASYNITSKDNKKVRMRVSVTKEDRFIYNVIGTLQGHVEPDRLVLIGNHQDAWTFGGADPSSGTATMLEVAKALGWLKTKGWKPRRSIVFCSWDAEEHGLMGSTEWVEDHAKLLSHRAVAYLNVDVAVEGNHTLELKSTPYLEDAFYDIVKMFKDPDEKDKNLYDTWVKKKGKGHRFQPDVSIFGAGSDYMQFFGSLGIAALDLRYTFDPESTGDFIYPLYHTMHDNFDWVKRFLDPDFKYHETIAKLLIQLTLKIADSVILPFNVRPYAKKAILLAERVENLKKDKVKLKDFDLGLLRQICNDLEKAMKTFTNKLLLIDKKDALAVRMANDKMMLFERSFVLSEDVPGERTRHLYHTSGLEASIQSVKEGKAGAVKDLEIKLTIFAHHLKMAAMSLQNF